MVETVQRQVTSADVENLPTNDAMQALTERVSQTELHHRFVDALGSAVRFHGVLDRKPLEADLAAPLPARIRLYIFNATRPPGGRPLGEHKVQLIVPGQRRGTRASFDQSGGRIVLLSGYAAEENVFVIWDAGLYADFAWSRNVQVRVRDAYSGEQRAKSLNRSGGFDLPHGNARYGDSYSHARRRVWPTPWLVG